VAVPQLRSRRRPRSRQIGRTRWAAAPSPCGRGITLPHSRSRTVLLRCCNQKWPFVRISGASEGRAASVFAALHQGIDVALHLLDAASGGELHHRIVVVLERIGRSWRPVFLWNRQTDHNRFVVIRRPVRPKGCEKMDPADVCCRPGAGQKAEDGLNLPARSVKLEPIPKASLYKIAHYCRFVPAQKSSNRSKHCRSGGVDGAAATISQFYAGNKSDARRCNDVRSIGVSPRSRSATPNFGVQSTERINLRQVSATIAGSHAATVERCARGRSVASPLRRPAPADRCRSQPRCLRTRHVRFHGFPSAQRLPGHAHRRGSCEYRNVLRGTWPRCTGSCKFVAPFDCAMT
jgi:hypothetical protein